MSSPLKTIKIKIIDSEPLLILAMCTIHPIHLIKTRILTQF